MTVANRFGELPLSAVASSPAAVGEGKLWLFASSAVIADRPALVSLLGFWIVGFTAFAICSARVIAGVAVGGHLFSALCIYSLIGLARLARPDAFGSVMHVSDYGLSAIIAAWIGAIASVMWRRIRPRRHSACRRRSLLCAGVGLLFRPDLTYLDTEHLVAYAFGALLASERVVTVSRLSAAAHRGRPRVSSLPPRRRSLLQIYAVSERQELSKLLQRRRLGARLDRL